MNVIRSLAQLVAANNFVKREAGSDSELCVLVFFADQAIQESSPYCLAVLKN